MKNVALYILLFSFAGSSTIFADEQPKTCWETLHTIATNLSADFSCVVETAKMPIERLCSPDGLEVTSAFKPYLVLRSRYLSVRAEGDAWIAANPEASQLPISMAAKIKNAETAWMVAGKRFQIDNEIEKIKRQSATCQ